MSSKKFNINGFPTLLFFIKGEPIEFQGVRSSKSLVNWARKKIGIPLCLLNTKEDLKKFKSDNDICLVYYGNITEEIKRFSDVSLIIEEYPFGLITNSNLIKKYSKEGTVVLYKHFDEKKLELRNFNKIKLIEFIKQNALPKVMLFNDKSVQYIFQKKNPALVLFESNKTENWNYYLNSIGICVY